MSAHDNNNVRFPQWLLPMLIALLSALMGGAASWSVYSYRVTRLETMVETIASRQTTVLQKLQHYDDLENQIQQFERESKADRLSLLDGQQKLMMALVRTHPGAKFPGIINQNNVDPFRLRGLRGVVSR